MWGRVCADYGFMDTFFMGRLESFMGDFLGGLRDIIQMKMYYLVLFNKIQNITDK